MKRSHEYRKTNYFSISATDVASMAHIVAHYEKLGEQVAWITRDPNDKDEAYTVRLSAGKLRDAGKIYDVRATAYASHVDVRELERVLIIDLAKAS